MQTLTRYEIRKLSKKARNYWFPEKDLEILRKASEATGLTQTEIILRGINLVASQEKVTL